jgi:hypothetical protein
MLRVMQFTLEKHREAGTGGDLSDWYRKDLSPTGRAEFDALLRTLAKMRAKDWTTGDYKPLKGNRKYAGVYELRFKQGGIQYRPLCFLLPQADVGGADLDVLVLLIGAYKKSETWTPREARETAGDRMKLVLQDRSLIHDYTW